MSFCAFAQFVTAFTFFSASDKSLVKWDHSRNSIQKMRTLHDRIYLIFEYIIFENLEMVIFLFYDHLFLILKTDAWPLK